MSEGHEVTYDLTCFGTALDISDQFLLLLFQLRPLSVEFPLCLCECPLVLPESFGRSNGPPKKRLLM